MPGTSSWLATFLDADMLVRNSAVILDPLNAGSNPPVRSGTDVSRELGGRLLLRYVAPYQLGQFRHGSRAECYATPTAYTPDEVVKYVLLPGAGIPREHVLLLDPSRIRWIQGPMWVALARGVQYTLPDGFPEEAIVVPGAPTTRWELPVA